MKTHTKTRLLWPALVASLLAAPLTLSASIQPEGRRGHRQGRGHMLRELDLTQEQRDQMRTLREQGSREAFERVREAKKALDDAVEAGADEGTLRQLGYQYGEAEGEAAIERSRMNAQFLQILTPEQREKYEALKAEREKEMEQRRERMRERMENRRNRDPGGSSQ